MNEMVTETSESISAETTEGNVELRKALDHAVFCKLPLSDIVIAPRPPKDDDKSAVFYNARFTQGFDPEKMQKLEDWIADAGLICPLLVRDIPHPENPKKTVYQIIAGERRTRAIRKLVQDNRTVLNPSTQTKEPAAIVYETVDCRLVKNCDDMLAITLSWMENDQSEPIGEGDTIDLCERLVNLGFKPKEIAENFLKKSQSWVSHTLSFRKKLSEEEFDELRNGEMTRSVAIRLMDYTPEQRAKLKQVALDIAQQRKEEILDKIEVDVVAADVTLEAAESIHAEAEFEDDPKKLARAEKVVARAKKKQESVKVKQKKVKDSPVTIQQADLEEGAHRMGIESENGKTLSGKVIKSNWVNPLKEMLQEREIKDPVSGNVVPRQHVELAVAIATAIDDGKRDAMSVLRSFYTSIGAWESNASEVESLSQDEDDDIDVDDGEDAIMDEFEEIDDMDLDFDEDDDLEDDVIPDDDDLDV